MSAPARILRSRTANYAAPARTHSFSSSSPGRLRPLLHSGPETTAPSNPATLDKARPPLQKAAYPDLPDVWFSATFPPQNVPSPPDADPSKPRDSERKVKLGTTLRILQERLPTLLQTPLPQEVLSPNITLHLFPSTHPHLPTVSGRVAYVAALWTSPIAWNRVPIVGNVKLEILSERMVDLGSGVGPRPLGAVGEQLVVRWRTIGKGKNWGLPFINGGGAPGPMLSGTAREFTGLFIFDFDKEGRILSHTIEHSQSSGQWEKGVGAKVVGLTDWLLGGFKGGREGSDGPCPAFKDER
ncbi:hypothetical protein GQ53DRAFT_816755 [Thozetella sp. PMI_491]|nr:hypothetical protein GQ53DRAFT_816755 [Thozetella sp. PMI_491]